MSETAQRLQAASIRPGDLVRLVGAPNVWLTVTDTSDPALLTLAAPNGAEIKAGRLTVSDIQRQEHNR